MIYGLAISRLSPKFFSQGTPNISSKPFVCCTVIARSQSRDSSSGEASRDLASDRNSDTKYLQVGTGRRLDQGRQHRQADHGPVSPWKQEKNQALVNKALKVKDLSHAHVISSFHVLFSCLTSSPPLTSCRCCRCSPHQQVKHFRYHISHTFTRTCLVTDLCPLPY